MSAPSTCIPWDMAIHPQSQAQRKTEFKEMIETLNPGLPTWKRASHSPGTCPGVTGARNKLLLYLSY